MPNRRLDVGHWTSLRLTSIMCVCFCTCCLISLSVCLPTSVRSTPVDERRGRGLAHSFWGVIM